MNIYVAKLSFDLQDEDLRWPVHKGQRGQTQAGGGPRQVERKKRRKEWKKELQ